MGYLDFEDIEQNVFHKLLFVQGSHSFEGCSYVVKKSLYESLVKSLSEQELFFPTNFLLTILIIHQ